MAFLIEKPINCEGYQHLNAVDGATKASGFQMNKNQKSDEKRGGLKGKVLVVRIVSDDFTRKLTWNEGAENNSSSCFHELRTTKQCFNR